MKIIIFRIFITAVLTLCVVNISSAEDCKGAEEMLSKVVSKNPDAKTEENIRTAIAQCPGDPSLYSRAGDYFSHWYKTESNATFRLEYKKLAMEFYRQGVEHAEGSTAEQMKLKADNLEGKREWSKLSFRGLTPVAPDSKDMGLRLKINFAFNSYELTKTAQQHLNELGEELAVIESIRISLQGHTDMRGEAYYNKELSIRRAESAKDYLVDTFNINPERIVTLGFGFDHLADEDNPYSPVNRRVEVLKIAQ
jgi:outer membrane protein OmpA-like peptidoglycan-associated protein